MSIPMKHPVCLTTAVATRHHFQGRSKNSAHSNGANEQPDVPHQYGFCFGSYDGVWGNRASMFVLPGGLTGETIYTWSNGNRRGTCWFR